MGKTSIPTSIALLTKYSIVTSERYKGLKEALTRDEWGSATIGELAILNKAVLLHFYRKEVARITATQIDEERHISAFVAHAQLTPKMVEDKEYPVLLVTHGYAEITQQGLDCALSTGDIILISSNEYRMPPEIKPVMGLICWFSETQVARFTLSTL